MLFVLQGLINNALLFSLLLLIRIVLVNLQSRCITTSKSSRPQKD